MKTKITMKITRNKNIKNAYVNYLNTGNCHLYDAYKNPSSNKERAFRYCIDLMKDYDGAGIKIIGHNCMTFSVGFIGYIDGLKHFFYITRDYDRALPLETMDRETGEVMPASL